jgi:hypothetical protein
MITSSFELDGDDACFFVAVFFDGFTWLAALSFDFAERGMASS